MAAPRLFLAIRVPKFIALSGWGEATPLGGSALRCGTEQAFRSGSGQFRVEFFTPFHLEISGGLSREKRSWLEMTTPTTTQKSNSKKTMNTICNGAYDAIYFLSNSYS